MSDKKLYKNKYRITSVRAQWHDYDGGMYFVTINTIDHYFGKIENTKMHLTDIGVIAENNLKTINEHYPYAEIPLYVVMPNHIHAIVIIDSSSVARNAATDSMRNSHRCVARNASNTPKNKIMSEKSPKWGTLPVVIRGFKSAVTKYANEQKISFKWQARYYDRIIRNQDELNRIAVYIENNIMKWEMTKNR